VQCKREKWHITMSQSCSGECQTFISWRPKMGSNFVRYYLIMIKELIPGQSDVRMPVQATHHERFSRHFLQLFSVRYLHDIALLIISTPDPEKSSPQSAQISEWFSNRNAPTRVCIDEPRPRQRLSSLAGKIIHLITHAYIYVCVYVWCVHMCAYVCVICVYVCVNVYVCMCVRSNACVYVCWCIWSSPVTHTHTIARSPIRYVNNGNVSLCVCVHDCVPSLLYMTIKGVETGLQN
jgi:hypothetical protein